MKLITRLVSSLVKIFPDDINGECISCATALKNEPFSFQVAFKCDDDEIEVIPIYIRVESDLDVSLISQYKVANVPVLRADHMFADDNFERKTAGLFPDVLLKRKNDAEITKDGVHWAPYREENEENILRAIRDSYQAVWFTVNENGEEIKSGKYPIKICFFGD